MIPLEQLRASSFYQLILEEGEKKGELNASAQALLNIIAKRFPTLEVTREVRRIKNAARLQELVVEVLDMKNAAQVKKRLAEILKK